MSRNRKKIIRAVTVAESLGFCREVMLKMRDSGYEMAAVSSPGPELDELREKDGFATHAVPMARHISLLSDIRSLFRMIALFRRERPQVVHSITPKAGLICMLAAWLTRVPVRIHMFTGLVWPTATGLKRRVLMATDSLTCACATHVIPEGHGIMEDLQAHITRKPMKVLGYGNVRGIDLERFDPGRVKTFHLPHSFTFLFVGRIVGDKGVYELVEAFAALNRKYPETRLVLVGHPEPELDPLPDGAQKLIADHPSIVFAGPKSGDELVQSYADADCFIMPSYREGFPNTVMEAGAMGLPSIVTEINGSREIIVDGENGLIVPPHTVQPLCDAMERVLTDGALREKMRLNARPMIASRFEKNFVQGCMIEFYKKVIDV